MTRRGSGSGSGWRHDPEPGAVERALWTERLLPGVRRERIFRPQGWLSPVVLVDGRMDGVWRHERQGARLIVEVEPFVALPRWARAGVEREAERLARFTGGELDLRWQT